MRSLLCTLTAAGLLLATSPDALAGKKLSAEAPLVRPDDAPDDDAQGELELRVDSDPSKDWQRFEVRVDHVDVDLLHEVFIQDGPDADTYTEVGDLEQDDDDDGGLKLKLFSKKGDAMPLGVDDLAELAGLRVEVRQDGAVVLAGDVPELGGAPGKPVKANAKLETGPDAAAKTKATLQLRLNPKKQTQRMTLRVWKLDFSDDAAYHLFVESGVEVDPDTGDETVLYEDVGEVEQLGSSANARYRRQSKQGDAMPLGLDLDELAGLRLEVRDGDGGVHVQDVFPTLD